jgi:hypothetical protein
LKDLVLTNHPDFRVDRVAVINYSDALQAGSPQFWGSILAHGIVDNIVVTVPTPPVANLTGVTSNGIFRASFLSRSNWTYSLERTFDFATWTAISPTSSGTAATMTFTDTNVTEASAFFRVSAVRP